MDAFTASSNPEGTEIDRESWYDTEMLKCKDIMQFIDDPEHFIFRAKWNANAWLEQFEEATPEKFNIDLPKDPRQQRGTKLDEFRHQLQTTVMLNTLGSIRQKRYFSKGREVKLNLNKNLRTIVYNHESKLTKSSKMPTEIPFSVTRIHVTADDCVVAYHKLAQKNKNPVLLNMASATSPGGGYRKGDGAQEENLFRRSDYFRSLDVGLDGFLSERTERCLRTSNCQDDPLRKPYKMYPMDEYGAIYTSGLTFFRQSQDVGYEYLEKPMENVCAIAMAAYRDPKLDKLLLSPKYAVGTRKKIENTFAIAHHHGHKSIVLSAFGCGAFRNPPKHVAKIFSSVIEQYAGFFDTIVFAIIDDHNSGQKLNPEGNYKPFLDELDGKHVSPVTLANKPNIMFGPYRVSSDGTRFNDINIFDSHPCWYAAKCTGVNNPTNTCTYSHPPLCARAIVKGKCDVPDSFVHLESFFHRKQCQYGGQCTKIDDNKHSQELEHPSYCAQESTCDDMTESHLRQYRHLPLCDKGTKCMDFKKKAKPHYTKYRHCQVRCQYGNACFKFHDKKHIQEESHPFPQPCPLTPFHCPSYTTLSEAADTRALPEHIHQHCLDYAHVCRFGRSCSNNTPLHYEKSIHIARRICEYDGKCTKMNQDEHLNSYTHKGAADIRRVCKSTHRCHELHDVNHIVKFRHARTHEENGIVHDYGLNNDVNFVENQANMIKRVEKFIKDQSWAPLPSGGVPRPILDWFRTVRPVHRCNPFVFESILLHGHVMSRDYMDNLVKVKFVVRSVIQHSRIRRIESLNIPQYAQQVKEYVTAIITAEFYKANFPPPDAAPGDAPAPPVPSRPSKPAHEHAIQSNENVLSRVIPQNDIDAIKTKAIEIAQASIKLHTNPAGIGHPPDRELGTHKRVFSILGPHLGHYYGDVFIVFKREILHHPDADYSMLAATSYGHSGNAYKLCPWLGTPSDKIDERIQLYHNSKLHASIPGHEYAIALQLMAITSIDFKLKSMDVDLDTIISRWLQTDSHRSIEAHLPQLIPLDYIDHIYIPKNVFDSFNAQTRKSISANFKHYIDVTPHTGSIGNPKGGFGPQPAEPDRVEYQKYVVGKLLDRCKQDANNPPPRPIEGATITIGASNFAESFVLPLTISQARELYRVQHKQDPPDDVVYIYWEAINGNMMLVVSNEEIETDETKKQPKLQCLLCYIGPKSDTASDYHYHEQVTYLNCGQPYKHHGFVKHNDYKAHSNTFHMGSNTDDFITYCLEIHRSTGKVVLRQAGSNSIYNHQEIFCEFKNPKELDLTKLEYVNITADNKAVTVRNLIVCFERQAQLHPKFDKDFKKPIPVSPAPGSGGHAGGGGHADGGGHAGGGDHAHAGPLTPCRDNVSCLLQYASGPLGKEHNSKHSHPCRFSELCRNKDKEPHLVHEPHHATQCRDDPKCPKVRDPSHRAQYRHKDLPDFLVPCREQKKCSDRSDEHLLKYSHGEQVYEKKGAAGSGSDDPRHPCHYGLGCKSINDADHRKNIRINN